MDSAYTAQRLFDEFMAEKRALGFKYKTGEGTIRRFIREFENPEDGNIEFTKEYVLKHSCRKLNQKDNTVLRDAASINRFLDFVIRKGFKAYKIPPKSLPKETRIFVAQIFTEAEIERILVAADNVPFAEQNPNRQHQIPVMFRILFNCGLRSGELLNLKANDINLQENMLTVRDTKFQKSRLVPFSDTVADALNTYFAASSPFNDEDYLFPSPRKEKYSHSGIHAHFHLLLRLAQIPYGGRGIGPRLHDIRHTFAVHCLNRWVLTGADLTAALPVLSRYLGHESIKGTQKYLQLTAQMYPDIVSKLEKEFGHLIPSAEVAEDEAV